MYVKFVEVVWWLVRVLMIAIHQQTPLASTATHTTDDFFSPLFCTAFAMCQHMTNAGIALQHIDNFSALGMHASMQVIRLED
jgi:uncharacterized protein YcsI (UPF0317 family)